MTTGNTLNLVDETLRDGTQSLWGMMMSYHMIEPVIEDIGLAGFDTITVPVNIAQAVISTRFFKEDPRHLFRMMKDKLRNTKSKVMMVGLGASLDISAAAECTTVVRLFQEQFKEWVPQINRVLVICCTEDEIQNTYPVLFPMFRKLGIDMIPYMAIGHGPRHTEEFYASRARHLVETYKPSSICIKDVDGLLTPERLAGLIKALQAVIGDTPLELHSHGMNGLQTYNAVVAMKMGLRTFTSCIPPLAYGSSHPSAFNLAMNAEQLGIDHGLDLGRLRTVEDRLTRIGRAFGHPVDNQPLPFELKTYRHQIPGGVISNTKTQLAQLGIPEKLDEVLDEIPRILEDLGHPIMITPFSQFIVTQAVLNVQIGRWEECLDSCVEFAAGIFGREESGVNHMNQDVKDRLLSLPQARKIQEKANNLYDYIRSEPSEAECKKRVGLPPTASREDYVLRYLLRGDEPLQSCTPGGPASYRKYLD